MPPAATTAVPRDSIACVLLALAWLIAVSPAAAQSPTLQPRAGQEPITPIPAARAQDPQRLLVGERLFSDRRLSHGNTHSCSSCHDIATNGASANVLDTPKSQPMALNTPTVFNASLNFRLNWEGKFRSLEEGAEHTLRNPAIMASNADEIVGKLRADPETVQQFREAYGREPDFAAVLDAIATFERSLVTSRRRSYPATSFSNHSAVSVAIRASMWVAICFSGMAFFIRWVRRSRCCFASPACETSQPPHPISTTAARQHCRRQ